MENRTSYVQILVDTLQRQADTLREILALTVEQSRIADRDPFEEGSLEDTMNRKEILIARLNELDEGFTAVYERVRRDLAEQKDQYKTSLQKIQNLIKECSDLSVEIRVTEERNRTKLAQCFAAKHKEYGSQQTAAAVASRYHQTMHNMQVVDPFFFNKKK